MPPLPAPPFPVSVARVLLLSASSPTVRPQQLQERGASARGAPGAPRTVPDVWAVQGQPQQVQDSAAQADTDEANEGNELQRERNEKYPNKMNIYQADLRVKGRADTPGDLQGKYGRAIL